jgi:CTP-dependent riboflavin kinase
MKNSKNSQTLLLQGVVVEGLGESANFTCLAWVKEQFIKSLGIDPYPGTFNLEVREADSLARFRKIKLQRGIEIAPGQPRFCAAKGFPVLVNGKIKGALIIPLVKDYPEGKLEIIAPVNIRQALSLKNGDAVTVEILEVSGGRVPAPGKRGRR